MRPRNLRPCGMQQALSACRPTRCTLVALGFNGSERVSKLGPVANNGENIDSGKQSLGMCLGVFDLVGCNGPCQHVGLGHLNGAFWPLKTVAFGFKGPERGESGVL